MGRSKDGQLPEPQLRCYKHPRAGVRKGEGAGKEGHRAGSQGCVAARATYSSVNTHPGALARARTHTHTHMPSELQSQINGYAQMGFRDAQRYAQATTHTHINIRYTQTHEYHILW